MIIIDCYTLGFLAIFAIGGFECVFRFSLMLILFQYILRHYLLSHYCQILVNICCGLYDYRDWFTAFAFLRRLTMTLVMVRVMI